MTKKDKSLYIAMWVVCLMAFIGLLAQSNWYASVWVVITGVWVYYTYSYHRRYKALENQFREFNMEQKGK